jgi:diguanylate cyclase (GGDEF)-like protein
MLESLDPRTLSLAASLSGFVLALVLWDAQRGDDRIAATRIWCISAVCCAIGFGLSVFQDVGPDWLTRLLSDTLLALAVVFLWSGIRVFRKLSTRSSQVAATAGIFAFTMLVWNIIFIYFEPSAPMRVIGLSVVSGCFAGLASWNFFMCRERHLRTGALVAAIPLALLVIALFARTVDAALSPNASNYAPTKPNIVAYIVIVLSVLAASAGAIMMVNAVRAERLGTVAYVDMLTGALSRRGLYRSLPTWFSKQGVDRAWLCVLDVDRFKQFNDGFGHEAGDVILKTVVSACRKTLTKDSIIARMGGDEFTAISAVKIDDEALRFAINTALVAASQRLSPLAPPTVTPAEQSSPRPAPQPKLRKTPRANSTPTIAIGSAPLLASDTASLADALRQADRKMYNGKVRQRELGAMTQAGARRVE